MRYADGLGAQAIREIVENERLSFSGKFTVALSYFVATQMFRIPTIRNETVFSKNSDIEMGWRRSRRQRSTPD
jgi:hypothetical protein